MVDFLLTLPRFAIIIILAIVFNIFSQGLLFLLHKYSLRGIFKGQNSDVFITSLNIVFSLIIAFVFIGVWQSHSNVNHIVLKESELIVDINTNINGYIDVQKNKAVPAFRDYVEEVVYKEYDSIHLKNKQDINAVNKLNKFNNIILAYEPATNGQLALQQEILKLVSEYKNIRRERCNNNEPLIENILWDVLLFITFIYIFLLCFSDIEKYNSHAFLVFVFSCSISTIFALLILYDRPFTGPQAIDYSYLKDVYDNFIKLPK
jgi:hypothetical protein